MQGWICETQKTWIACFSIENLLKEQLDTLESQPLATAFEWKMRQPPAW